MKTVGEGGLKQWRSYTRAYPGLCPGNISGCPGKINLENYYKGQRSRIVSRASLTSKESESGRLRHVSIPEWNAERS